MDISPPLGELAARPSRFRPLAKHRCGLRFPHARHAEALLISPKQKRHPKALVFELVEMGNRSRVTKHIASLRSRSVKYSRHRLTSREDAGPCFGFRFPPSRTIANHPTSCEAGWALVEMGGIEPPSEREDRIASTRVVDLEDSQRDIESRPKYPRAILEGSVARSGNGRPILQR